VARAIVLLLGYHREWVLLLQLPLLISREKIIVRLVCLFMCFSAFQFLLSE